MKYVRIINQSNPAQAAFIQAKYCQSFLCQLKGLMFTKSLLENQGILLVQSGDSKLNASIHMMFMWLDLAVVWINSEYTVVDKVLARRWKLAYIPQYAARFILETDVKHLSDYNIGDKVLFEET